MSVVFESGWYFDSLFLSLILSVDCPSFFSKIKIFDTLQYNEIVFSVVPAQEMTGAVYRDFVKYGICVDTKKNQATRLQPTTMFLALYILLLRNVFWKA